MEKPKERYRATIPDDDLPNWMQVLREGGMTEEEIDGIFCHTNKKWREAKLPEIAEKELAKIDNYRRKQNKKGLTDEERKNFKKAIEKGLRLTSEAIGEVHMTNFNLTDMVGNYLIGDAKWALEAGLSEKVDLC